MRGFRWLVLLILIWGVLSFGAVYPWAHWPLLTGCFATGLVGLIVGSASLSRAVAFGFAGILAGLLVQLIPVPRPFLAYVSPGSDAFLKQHEIAEIATALPPIALALNLDTSGAATNGRARPLSINPANTRRGLLFVVSFVTFILGLSRVIDRRHARFLLTGLTIFAVGVSIVAVAQKALPGNTSIYGFWTPLDIQHPHRPSRREA